MTKHRKNKPGTEGAADGAAALKLDNPANTGQPRLKSKREEAEVKAPNKVMRLFNFFKDAKKELTKVTWPTRKETVKSTGVLLVLVAISAAYLGLVDSLLSWLLQLVVS